MTLLGKPTAPTYKHGTHMIQAQTDKLGLDIEPGSMCVMIFSGRPMIADLVFKLHDRRYAALMAQEPW